MQWPEVMELIPLAIAVSALIVLSVRALIGFAFGLRRPAWHGESHGLEGETMETSGVARRVQEVRLDYVGGLAKRPLEQVHRRERVQAARALIEQCGYFHHDQSALRKSESA